MSGKVFLPVWVAFTGMWLYGVLKLVTFLAWKLGA